MFIREVYGRIPVRELTRYFRVAPSSLYAIKRGLIYRNLRSGSLSEAEYQRLMFVFRDHLRKR